MAGRIAQQEGDDLLRTIAGGAAAALTGAEFLRQLTRSLAQVMDARYAFICEYLSSRRRVRDLAFWADGNFQKPGEYDIDGTPCEYVLAGELKCYPRHVAELFPKYTWLAEVGAESYLAIPLKNDSGEILGHMGVMDTKPLERSPADLSVFEILGARACAELERQRFEEALKQSEARLSRVLGSAMDAIITIDADRHIVFFNPAAERIFGCAAAWAAGQPFDRFLAKPLRGLLDGFLKAAEQADAKRQQMWAPQGLTALRANREEFPIEATIASIEADGRRHYTIVLRDVKERVRAEAELGRLQQQNIYLQQAIQESLKFEEMVGDSAPMQALYKLIETVAASDTTVLINGETGTGKELVAQAIHKLGARRERLLVNINCAALPSELIESELFGHEKGAFTGATSQRKGRFELADGGSIFLDEVGELSPAAQAKLLRILQEQEFERVGGTRTIKIDVRVIAATNRDFGEMVKAGSFRSDLYYRLNVFPVTVPPLRERGADILTLAQHFLGRYAHKLGKALQSFDAESLRRLGSYSWPGNVRELQNVVERAAILAQRPIVHIPDLARPAAAAAPETDLRTLEQIESEHIRAVLQMTDWVVEGKRGAAAILGLEPSTLRYRMQKLGIRRPRAGNVVSS
ncbi:MAG: sigma-54 interaction domain-containing protein [Chromatiales bacterium]